MIVDCHTHINVGSENFDPTSHLEAAETVDACIVLPHKTDSSDQLNEQISEYVNKYKSKMVGFAFIDPTKDDIRLKNLESMTKKLHLQGVVLYCSSCGFHLAHSRAMRFYESAQELGLPVFFHSAANPDPGDVLDYTQPILLDEIARTFPDLKIIISNMGRPFIQQTLAVIGKNPNVYADLTIHAGNVWQVYNTVTMSYEAGVMDKLLFGSGFPLESPGRCIETLLGFNKLLADTHLPTVPRKDISNIIERDTLKILSITTG
jgi:predicted TIM-barrel fold metal-dependent hydrolase